MIRLRQVALVAADLDREVDALCTTLGLRVCFNEPGMTTFGLHNALMVIGDQFLEVVSPTEEGTTAGRLLDKRHGDGGYMAMYEVDDLDRRVDHLQAHGVRIVWSGDLPDIRGRHLHPRDVGGTLVSVDQPVPNGSWTWGGPSWVAHGETSVVAAIAGVVVGATDPEAMRARWREHEIDAAVRFVEAGPRGEGLDGVDLVASDRDRVGEVHELCGTRFVLV
jgi:catechol 2,3-dioxygenase-like lactoylglutathione lyase family enzyme